MHQLTMCSLEYWMDKSHGALAGKCSCELSFQGHTEEEIRKEHREHKDSCTNPPKCEFCDSRASYLSGE